MILNRLAKITFRTPTKKEKVDQEDSGCQETTNSGHLGKT